MKLLKVLCAGALMVSLTAFCSCSGSDKKEVDTRVNMAVTDTTDVKVDTSSFLKRFKDLDMKESIDLEWDKDETLTSLKMRVSVPLPIDTFNKLKTVQSGFTFGYGMFAVDKTTKLKDLTFKGYYPATTFDEKFSKYLITKTFLHQEFTLDQFGFVDKKFKVVDNVKDASYAQANWVFSVLGKEDLEVIWFSYLACDGNLVITDSRLTSAKDIAERYVKTGETTYGECLDKTGVNVLCKHFEIKKPWYSDMQIGYKGMLNDHMGWTITLSCLSALGIVLAIFGLIVFIKKKMKG